MSITRGVSVDGQLLPDTTGTLYSLPATRTRAVITAVSVHANAVSGVNLFVVPSGGSDDTTNQTTDKALAANETYTAPEIIGLGIETGGTIQGNDQGNGGAGANIILTVTEFDGDS